MIATAPPSLDALYSAQTLLNFSNRLSTALTPDDLIAAYTEVAGAEHIEVVTLYYIDNDDSGQPTFCEVASSQSYSPQRQALPIPTRFYLPDFSMTQLWINQPDGVVLIGDRATSPRVDEASRAVFKSMGSTSFALLPLYISGRWAGLMQIDFEGTRDFPPEAEAFYITMARTMAWRVATLREAAELRRQADRIDLINRVNAALAQAVDEPQIVEALAPLADRYGATQTVLFYTKQNAENNIDTLLYQTTRLKNGVIVPAAQSPYGALQPEMMQTLSLILETPDKPSFIEDFQAPDVLTQAERDYLKAGNVAATIFMPLRAGTVWQGILTFVFNEKQTFTPELRDLFIRIRPSVEAVVIARRNLLDIETRRKQAEGSLQTSEDRLRFFVSNVPAILFGVDENAILTFAGGAGLTGIGLRPELIVGKSAYETFNFDGDDLKRDIERALKGNSFQTITTNGSGSFQNIYTALQDERGQVTGVIGLSFDITERERAETERKRLIRELRETSRFKDEFLATMSHELRTPLNAMIGLLGIVLMGNRANETDRNMITRARANSERLLALINNVLDISRIEAGRLEIVPDVVAIRTLAERVESDLHVLADQKHLAFKVQVGPTVPETIFADEDAINKIVVNLVSNAIKFTEKGEVVLSLDTQTENGKMLLIIETRDTGIGIPAHMHDVIFESFRQVDGSTTRAFGGSGLGLSIVRSMCLAMKGRYRVQSEVGEGSTFTVIIPLEAIPQTAVHA